MKRFITLVCCITIFSAFAVALTACGNMSMGMGNYTFEKVHVDTYHYTGCLTVEKWYDNSAGIEVLTDEAGPMFLSEGTYILLEGDKDCPFCAANSE